MRVSLKDVAKLANVSVATASLALNNKPVNETTRSRVITAAEKLNYVATSSGRRLQAGKSFVVGIFVLDSKAHRNFVEECAYYYDLIRGVVSESTPRGYSVMFEDAYWDDRAAEQMLFRKVSGGEVDGAIIIPQFSFPYDFLDYLESVSFPFVLCNPVEGIAERNCVEVENRKGAYAVGRYLLAAGYTHLALVNGPARHYEAQLRAAGFEEALREASVSVRDEWWVESDFTMTGGYQTFRRLLETGEDHPNALFCANDYMAAGAMRAIRERGLRVPDDIAVAGFDNSEISRAVYPQLTTVDNPTDEVGRQAARRVFDLIAEPGADLPRVTLPARIVERESVPCA